MRIGRHPRRTGLLEGSKGRGQSPRWSSRLAETPFSQFLLASSSTRGLERPRAVPRRRRSEAVRESGRGHVLLRSPRMMCSHFLSARSRSSRPQIQSLTAVMSSPGIGTDVVWWRYRLTLSAKEADRSSTSLAVEAAAGGGMKVGRLQLGVPCRPWYGEGQPPCAFLPVMGLGGDGITSIRSGIASERGE